MVEYLAGNRLRGTSAEKDTGPVATGGDTIGTYTESDTWTEV